MTRVTIDLFRSCLIGGIITAISDAINNAYIKGSCVKSMNCKRLCLSFMQNVSKPSAFF